MVYSPNKYRETEGIKDGFSTNHSVPYSVIGLQEVNLVFTFGQVYWCCAVLTINSGASDSEEEEFEVLEDEEESEDEGSIEEEKAQKAKKKVVKYEKIAVALCGFREKNINVDLPEINLAKADFRPNASTNSIVYSLRAITGIGDDLIQEIVSHRPYVGLQDFISRVPITCPKTINLVKAGSFDALEGNDRVSVMKKCLRIHAIQSSDCKVKLTMQNFPKIIEYGVLPDDKKIYGRYYKYRDYIKNKKFLVEPNMIKLDAVSHQFFTMEFAKQMKQGTDYFNFEDTVVLNLKEFEKVYKKKMDELKDWLTLSETIDKYNELMYDSLVSEMWDKYCGGSIYQWEMESLNFYYTRHELANVNYAKYGISEFKSLPEVPIVTSETTKGGKKWKKYQLSKIVGTILGVNKTKHIIYVLTPDGAVVNVKFFSGLFIHYNKQISESLGNGKKKVIEKSWFKRGNKVIIAGYRDEDYFKPKKYFDSIYRHTICLIESVDQNGDLGLKLEREGGQE